MKAPTDQKDSRIFKEETIMRKKLHRVSPNFLVSIALQFTKLQITVSYRKLFNNGIKELI